ncbi:MAG: hypothetical protein NC328_04230 [Muribaculum sp.]|nr:hypothetical protein [Muribaculum sp.]
MKANTTPEEKISPATLHPFKGYSINELHYRRALVAMQKEIARDKVLTNVLKLQRHSPFSKDFGKDRGKFGKATMVVEKITNGLNYFDYAMLGYTLFNSGRKIWSFFRRTK